MTSRSPLSVDVIIPTHTPHRPVERAISSVLDDAERDVSVVLVCHGTPARAVLQRVPRSYHSRVTVIEHKDGVPSPAGPFNAGIRAATGAYVSPMSSDDYVRPGALRGWTRMVKQTRADVVVARVESDHGRLQRNPPTRLGLRTLRLDPDRDRLFYRTVPQGLLRRDLVTRLGGYTEGMVSGEDIALSARLWASGALIAFALHEPAYVLADDADDRVSLARRPVALDLEPVDGLLADAWVAGLDEGTRLALCVKLLRIHVFGALTFRTASGLSDDDRTALGATTRRVLDASQQVQAVLSIAETRLVRAILDGAGAEELMGLSRRRNAHGHPDTLLTQHRTSLLHRHAPARLMAASAAMSLGLPRRTRSHA